MLDRLRTVDEVAYLRFASVYKNFDAAADFHRELELLSKLPAGDPRRLCGPVSPSRWRSHRVNVNDCSSTAR